MDDWRDHEGFTLVELVIVLFVIALVAGLAVHHVVGIETRWLRGEAAMLRLRLNHAGDQALISHEPIAWFYDDAGTSYRFMVRSGDGTWRETAQRGLSKHHLDHPLKLHLERAGNPVNTDDRTPALVFYPGGEYTPFTLVLGTEKHGGHRLSGDGLNGIVLEVDTMKMTSAPPRRQTLP